MVERKNNSRSVIASLQNLPVTPRKVRLVVDLIRHLPISTALNVLENVPKRSAPMILKLLNSAVANATNNFGYNFNHLKIQEIYVNEGRKLKRFRPKAKGATAPLWKRASHVHIVLASAQAASIPALASKEVS